MATVRRDITIPQGGIFRMNIAVQNSDKTVRDLTGYSARMQVRESVSSLVTLVEATTANGYITISLVSGIVMVLIPSDITEAMVWSAGVYDLEIYTDDTDVERLVEGNAALSLEVTR